MVYRNKYQEPGITPEQLRAVLAHLQNPRTVRRRGQEVRLNPRVVQDGDRYHSTELYQAEKDIARHIHRLQKRHSLPLEIPADAFGTLEPDESQRAALDAAANSNVVILTGGPGVGKTTVAR